MLLCRVSILRTVKAISSVAIINEYLVIITVFVGILLNLSFYEMAESVHSEDVAIGTKFRFTEEVRTVSVFRA